MASSSLCSIGAPLVVLVSTPGPKLYEGSIRGRDGGEFDDKKVDDNDDDDDAVSTVSSMKALGTSIRITFAPTLLPGGWTPRATLVPSRPNTRVYRKDGGLWYSFSPAMSTSLQPTEMPARSAGPPGTTCGDPVNECAEWIFLSCNTSVPACIRLVWKTQDHHAKYLHQWCLHGHNQ